MVNIRTENIRNIAIIAHVDHGKTTLVDFLLKQANVFRENAEEMGKTLIMDSNDLEKERGITILAKNASVFYQGYKINIIDTPGHADFGGEVERTLSMADGCLLLVDAQEGPMPQTRFVLKKALQRGLKPIVVINKIDKPARRIPETLDAISGLFLELASDTAQLDFPVLYAIGREGKVFESVPDVPLDSLPGTLKPLFEKIIGALPPPGKDSAAPFQMQVSAIDTDPFKGVYAIGRIVRGTVREGMAAAYLSPNGKRSIQRIGEVFVWEGLNRVPVPEAIAGDIVAVTGFESVEINATLCDPGRQETLPMIVIDAPTLQITIGVNTSPFVGQDGNLLTTRQLRARLLRELETNVSLRMVPQGEKYLLSGRGELHLSILLETLRREGFELEVSQPVVITKEENGCLLEPFEEVTIDVPEIYRGVILSELAKRRADLKDTFFQAADVRFIYEMPTRALLGLRSLLATLTRGNFILNASFLLFRKTVEALPKTRKGVLIAHESGKATAYGLNIAQGRGATFIEPGEEVYEGMLVGENAKEGDIEINVCKGKALTNMRSKASDGIIQLAPPVQMGLEVALNFIADDELLEITPKHIRMRKRYLGKAERSRNAKTMSLAS